MENVFDARAASERALERRAEAAMANELGRTFFTIVRSVAALKRLIGADPYAGFRLPRNAKRVVSILRERHKGKLALPPEVDGARTLAVRWDTVRKCAAA